jgi:cell division protein FtsW (lipid II flippase)
LSAWERAAGVHQQAMVMGLIPVVGVPLPLASYGGMALLAVMFGFGLC